MTEDMGIIDRKINTLKLKGVKVVNVPSNVYDMPSLLPFLLINDHSVLVLRDPRKELVPLLT